MAHGTQRPKRIVIDMKNIPSEHSLHMRKVNLATDQRKHFHTINDGGKSVNPTLETQRDILAGKRSVWFHGPAYFHPNSHVWFYCAANFLSTATVHIFTQSEDGT